MAKPPKKKSKTQSKTKSTPTPTSDAPASPVSPATNASESDPDDGEDTGDTGDVDASVSSPSSPASPSGIGQVAFDNGRLSPGKLLDAVLGAIDTNVIAATFIAGAVGSAAWPLTHPYRAAIAAAHRLEWDERVGSAITTVVVTLAVAAGIAVYVKGRSASAHTPWPAALDRFNRLASVLLAAPLLAQLLPMGIERRSMPTTLLLVALVAAIVGVWLARFPADVAAAIQARFAAVDDGTRTGLYWAGLAAVFVASGSFIAWRAVVIHRALGTTILDLGLYDNIMWQSWHGNFLACSFMQSGVHHSAHFDPILVLLSPLYALRPEAESLVVFQAFWIQSALFPIALLARRTTSSRAVAFTLGACCAIYPAAHGVALYHFHSLALVIPVAAWVVYAAFTQRWRVYWAAVVVACLVREDIPLLLSSIGFSMMLTQDSTQRRMGAATIASTLLYFAAVKKLVMVSDEVLNCSKGGVCFAYYFEDLIVDKKGGIEIIMSLFSEPGYVLEVATREPKLVFYAQLFLPLLFLPFAVRSWRWMLLWGVTFTALASKPAVYSIAFQYCSLIFPLAFALTAIALGRANDGASFAWLRLSTHRTLVVLTGAIAVSSLLCTMKFGGLVPNEGFVSGWGRPVWGLSDDAAADYAWLREQVEKIGPDATVSVLNRLGPHFSGRTQALRFGHMPHKNADYVAVHMRDFRKKKRRRFLPRFEAIQKDTENWEVFAQRGQIWIMKNRNRDPDAGRSDRAR